MIFLSDLTAEIKQLKPKSNIQDIELHCQKRTKNIEIEKLCWISLFSKEEKGRIRNRVLRV